MVHLVHKRRASWSYYNQALCALRFVYNITLGKDWILKSIVCPKQEKKLPVVLSPAEVCQFFQAITNLKHRAILMTAYAAGLRVSEVVALRVEDIDSRRMVIRVRQAKGARIATSCSPLDYWIFFGSIGRLVGDERSFALIPGSFLARNRIVR